MKSKKKKQSYKINGKEYKSIPKKGLELVPPSNKSKFMQSKGMTNKDLENPIVNSMISEIKEFDELEEMKKQKEYFSIANNKKEGSKSDIKTVQNNNYKGNGLVGVQEQTELGQALNELNKDDIEANRMSSIDMRANLHPIEKSAILACDALVAFKFFPIITLMYTRQSKRLSASVEGKGRQQIVDISAGKRENDNGGKSLLNMFKGGQSPPPQ